VILLKLSVQPKSIPLPRLGLAIAALLTVSMGTAASTHGGPQTDLTVSTDTPFNESSGEILGGLEGWTEAPEYVRLFAPEAHQSQYRAFVSADPLATVVARIRSSAGHPPAGAWAIEDLGPLDAFGLSGRYIPYRLSRLYTAGPAHVARGPHGSSRSDQTWTLVSPYPDSGMTHVSSGTLLLVMRIPPL
jgi:hypothetical protein